MKKCLYWESNPDHKLRRLAVYPLTYRGCPHRESNPDHKLRRLAVYPLTYEGVLAVGFEPTNHRGGDLKSPAFDRFATLAC